MGNTLNIELELEAVERRVGTSWNAQMTVFMFWNVNGKSLYRELALACREHHVDILILAESKLNAPTLLAALNSDGGGGYFEPPVPSPRLQFFIRYLPNAFEPVYDNGRIAMRRLRPPVGPEVLIIAAHLPSKRYAAEDDQRLTVHNLVTEIDRQERQQGHRSSFVIGDLNMNPFDRAMVGSNGLHALMDRSIAVQQQRVVQGEARQYFYNPMWSRMGDDSAGPSGTYFYNSGKVTNYFWHTFDQVLLRPSLLPYFSSKNLSILTKIGDSELIRDSRINSAYSDHLPVVLKLDLERSILT